MLSAAAVPRWRAARPFALLGGVAIIVGGLLAAAVAHDPRQQLVWLSAYLVLIVGVAQIVFGAGQAWLSMPVPRSGWVAGEWLVFNLGNTGVIVGTLAGWFWLVVTGTLLFAVAIALFLAGTRGDGRHGWLASYRVLLGLIFLSSLVGLGLAAAGSMR
ncbi:MAG TPA: hypothetical protein VFY97_04660 [Rhodanobacteraceae bacterium]|nr:hypothetical protein [Rhodanobacteraceae bacterium]